MLLRRCYAMAPLAQAALVLLLAGGCASPQRPYQFTTSQMARDPLEALAAALTQAGHPPVVLDPQTGTASTRWVDTGIRAGVLKNQDATVVRRYTAKLVRGSFGNYVTLSADAERCAVHAFVLTEIDVQGTCVPMERLLPQQQTELINLGQRLEQSMAIP